MISRGYPSAGYGCLFLAALGASPASAGQWTYTVIGSTAPDNPQGFTSIDGSLNAIVINDHGDVAFAAAAQIKGAVVQGAWRARSGRAPVLLAAAGANETAGNVSINRSGSVSFVTATSSGPTQSQVVTVTTHGVTTFPTIFNDVASAAIDDKNQPIALDTGKLFRLSSAGALQVSQAQFDVGGAYVVLSGVGLATYPQGPYNDGVFETNVRRARTLSVVGSGGKEGTVTSPAINDTATVVFLGTTLNFQGGNVNGLYTINKQTEVSLISSVDNGTCTPSGPPNGKGDCTYVAYGPPSISTGGLIVVPVSTTNFVGTRATTIVQLAVNGDLANGVVASTGSTIAGCTIAKFSVGQQAINTTSQVTALLNCTDMSQRIIVAAPS